jgi:hypothetical protein
LISHEEAWNFHQKAGFSHMEAKASRRKGCSFCQEDGRIGRVEHAVRKTGFVRFQILSSGKPDGAPGHRGQAG